jgi:hypothetical protein
VARNGYGSIDRILASDRTVTSLPSGNHEVCGRAWRSEVIGFIGCNVNTRYLSRLGRRASWERKGPDGKCVVGRTGRTDREL